MRKSKARKNRKGRPDDSESTRFHGANSTNDGNEVGGTDDTRSEVSSVASGCSDHTSDRSIENNAADEDGESNVDVDNRDAEVKEAIEGLLEKSAKHRQDCLKIIMKHFLKSDMSEILETHKDTLSSALEKCVRKGKSEEQCLAAVLIAIVGIQIGSVEGGEEMFKNFKSVLLPVIMDKSANVNARAKCCEALGLYCFVAASEISELVECMTKLESIFRNSYFKGDGTVPVVSPAVCNLHNSALLAWGLLLSVCNWSSASELVRSSFSQLPALLQSADVDLRITAGETIALFYEILYNEDELEMATSTVDEEELCECLKGLATDSNKHRAKKDRRQQRSSFRDILKTVEGGVTPDERIKFGKEVLELFSWTRKRQYEAFRSILGTGLNYHLKSNDLLRDVFELGPPIPDDLHSKGSSSHFERHLRNQAVFKARTKVRGKLRDKRTAFRS